MSLWQNSGTDLGEALSHQQQLIDGKVAQTRYFWLSLPATLTPAELANLQQPRLLQLMQNHQALTSYYATPADLSVTRAQVQSPRLDFRIYQQDISQPAATDKHAAEQQAELFINEKQPHLPLLKEENAIIITQYLYKGWRSEKTDMVLEMMEEWSDDDDY